MKKVFLAFSIICIIMCGCSGNIPVPPAVSQSNSTPNSAALQTANANTGDPNVSSQYNAQEQYDIIIAGFKAKDAGRIKDLFCEKVKHTHDLDAEIAEAFRFIDGNIVSYFVDKAVSANGGAVENGNYIDIHAAPWILDIKTDTGAKYEIHFFSRLKYPDYPDEVGVQFIKVIKDNDDSFTIGEYIKGNYGA